MARSSFSNAAFALLARRLRHTSARYDRIAHQIRCRIRRTHHAKRRAYWVGLRIDTSKARACPAKYVSIHPPPVLDRSASSSSWVGTPAKANAYSTTSSETWTRAGLGLGIGCEAPGASQGNAYMREMPMRNLPKVVVRRRHRDGRQRIVLRLPPLKLQLNVGYPCGGGASQFQGPVPGAPRLSPRQLPEDECGMEDMVLESSSSSSSSTDGSESLLTPFDVRVYSGLCITVPPRNLKRKLQDVEDENVTLSQQPKRFLKARWDESKIQ